MHAFVDKEFGERAKQNDGAVYGGIYPPSLNEDKTTTYDACIGSYLARKRQCRFPVADALVAAVAGLDRLHHLAVHTPVHRTSMATRPAVLREEDLGHHEEDLEQQIEEEQHKCLEQDEGVVHRAEMPLANRQQEELQMEVQWQEGHSRTDMNRCVFPAIEITDGAQRMTPYSSKRSASWSARMLNGRVSSVLRDKHVYSPTP